MRIVSGMKSAQSSESPTILHYTRTTVATETKHPQSNFSCIPFDCSIRTIEGQILLTIDVNALFEKLARKALRSKGGKAIEVDGAVTATRVSIIKDRGTTTHRVIWTINGPDGGYKMEPAPEESIT